MQSSNVIERLFLGGILLSFSATALPSQTPDEEVLKRLSTEWMTAIERKDRKSLESVLADNFVLQMPGDDERQYVHRAEWLDNAIKIDWSSFRYENIIVQVHGDHATVSSRLFFKISPNPFIFDSGILDLWERREGTWQVTTRYLGDSKLKGRISFVFGALATASAIAAAYVIARLARWARKRAEGV